MRQRSRPGISIRFPGFEPAHPAPRVRDLHLSRKYPNPVVHAAHVRPQAGKTQLQKVRERYRHRASGTGPRSDVGTSSWYIGIIHHHSRVFELYRYESKIVSHLLDPFAAVKIQRSNETACVHPVTTVHNIGQSNKSQLWTECDNAGAIFRKSRRGTVRLYVWKVSVNTCWLVGQRKCKGKCKGQGQPLVKPLRGFDITWLHRACHAQ